MWLDKGRVRCIGPSAEVVREYLSGLVPQESGERVFAANQDRRVYFTKAAVTNPEGSAPLQGDDLVIKFELEARERVQRLQVSAALSTLEGHLVATVCNGDYNDEWTLEPGRHEVKLHLSGVRLLPRTHRLALRAMFDWGREMLDEQPEALTFHIQARDVLGTGVQQLADRGITWFPAQFQVRKTS
jgi:hypothetical protein